MKVSSCLFIVMFGVVSLGLIGCSAPGDSNNNNSNANTNSNTNTNGNGNTNAESSKPHKVELGETVKLVPNDSFPAEVKIQPANNNLDVIRFDGRLFLVFRTAPKHFASDQVELYVVSSKDEKTWEFEAKFFQQTDLREPRFFVWKDKLQLYFAQLGKDQAAFEPGQMYKSSRNKLGDWTKEEKVFKPGFIPWRFRENDGKPIMVGYDGGENIYKFNGQPLHVYLLTTTDGATWTPFNPQREYVLQGGTSETDIAFDNDGNLYAVARNEAGDKDGFGSKICMATKDDITKWTCKPDPKKYDSPLLFSHKNEIYLVGRRNMTKTGNYDLMQPDLTMQQQATDNQAAYWKEPKRCSLWHVNKVSLTVKHILDLPSKGDTCFPSIIKNSDNQYTIYNYSSDIDGPDRPWLDGQLNPTNIYSHIIKFSDN